MSKNSPIWITPTERDCDNCGFFILYGDDATCIFEKGVVKSPLKAMDPEPWYEDANDPGPYVFCDTWHPHCRATTAHRKAWYKGPQRERVHNQMMEHLVGPLDELHLMG